MCLLLPLPANRGLCGGFNNNVIKEIRNLRVRASGKNVKFFLWEKRHSTLQKTSNHTTEGFSETPYTIFDKLNFENATVIADAIMKQFASGQI
jgi:F-type H+-transporting ATPase subunit gamma